MASAPVADQGGIEEGRDHVSDWTSAPAGQVLTVGECRARDADGQGCAHGFVHLGPHQTTGLRAWLESTEDRALIRAYDAVNADRIEAMETPLFAQFQFVPIAKQELVRTKAGGLNPDWALLVGAFAPTEKVEFHLRLVCFGRPW
jgi:hypothetical protein